MTSFTEEDFFATHKRARQQGYRLMHRRNGQFWLMVGEPLTLEQISRDLDKMPVIAPPRSVRELVDQINNTVGVARGAA